MSMCKLVNNCLKKLTILGVDINILVFHVVVRQTNCNCYFIMSWSTTHKLPNQCTSAGVNAHVRSSAFNQCRPNAIRGTRATRGMVITIKAHARPQFPHKCEERAHVTASNCELLRCSLWVGGSSAPNCFTDVFELHIFTTACIMHVYWFCINYLKTQSLRALVSGLDQKTTNIMAHWVVWLWAWRE